jgi:UDPglucose 6-dehydrogenase
MSLDDELISGTGREEIAVKFDHLVLTRFNVRSGSTVASEDWLRHRLHYFRDVCCPSIRSQTSRQFHWLVFFDSEREVWFDEEIRRLSEDGLFEPVWFEGRFDSRIVASVAAEHSSAEWLITSRVDNDDAISRDFVEAVQSQFRDQEFEFINFQSGLQMTDAGELFQTFDPSGPFISLIEKRTNEYPRCVYLSPHTEVGRHGAIRQVKSHPMWLQIIHGRNLGNAVQGIRANPAALSAHFDIALAAAPVSRQYLIASPQTIVGPLYTATWIVPWRRHAASPRDLGSDQPLTLGDVVGCRIAVFGTGYLGATHAACMAELGHEVVGVDVDAAKLESLAAGEAPFFEPGLNDVLKTNVDAGRVRFTSSYAEAAAFADIHFIAVATPQKRGEFVADLTFVDSVIATLAPLLNRPAVIYGKSTVPVGTASRLSRMARHMAPIGDGVEVAWNPEFLREGYAVQDTLHPDRIVLGIDIENKGQAEKVARLVYADIIAEGVPFLVTDRETAELVKVAANAFLATKISFINAMAEVCEAAGADVLELADAIGYDTRIGRRFLNAGIGFGGGCLPKDIRAFMARAGELGANEAATLLSEVDSINMRRRSKMVELTKEIAGGSLLGTRVAVLGAAFKPDSDDTRDSPALDIAGQIQSQGASVTVYDPKAISNARKASPALDYVSSVRGACDGADVTLVLTEWEEFRHLDPADLGSIVRNRCIIDGRNCLDQDRWRSAGWVYRGIGRR